MAILLEDFKDQVALLGGGAMGIGRGTARLFAQRGARVAFFDIQEQAGRELEQELREKGIEARFYPCNVTVRLDVESSVEAVLRDFGQIDVLANIAGGSTLAPVWEMTEENWDAQLNLNLKAAFLMCRAVIPQMMERRTGAIVNVSSGQGTTPAPQRSAYSAAKAGIIGFSRSIAAELGPYGIRVNVVAPGVVATERIRATYESEEEWQKLLHGGLLGRIGQPEDIGNAILFLAGPLGRHLTGQTVHVNGGWYMP